MRLKQWQLPRCGLLDRNNFRLVRHTGTIRSSEGIERLFSTSQTEIEFLEVQRILPVQAAHGSGDADLAPYGESYAIAQKCSFEDD